MGYSREIFEEFAVESLEHLGNIEEDILKLFKEDELSDSVLIDKIFRSIHSIKGAAGFIKLEKIEKLANAMENMLSELRIGKIQPDDACADTLLQAADILTAMLKNVINSNDIDISEVFHRLNAQVKAVNSDKIPNQTQPDLNKKNIFFEINVLTLKNLSLTNEFLYAVKCDLSRICSRIKQNPGAVIKKFQNSGKIIDSNLVSCSQNLDKEFPKGPLIYFLLYSSLLNLDAMYNNFALEKDDVILINWKQLLKTNHISKSIFSKNVPWIVLKQDIEASSTDKISNQEINEKSFENVKSNSIRVDLEKLDLLINLVGELFIGESMMTNRFDIKNMDTEEFEHSARNLRRIISDIQDVAMSMRMVPLSQTFRKMNRLVHDLTRKLNKLCKLEIIGEETELDKTVIEQITDPLIHIVRNCLDHGIESPQERKAAGKPEVGTVKINARHQGGEVCIRISDDGKGLDYEKILQHAVQKGIISQTDNLSEQDIARLIFKPGFSTTNKVTDISGRGVGLDVVSKNINKLKGRTDIRSISGRGTIFLLRIPLTMAIIDGMLVRVGSNVYTIPLLYIRESFCPRLDQITNAMEGQDIVSIRDKLIPIIRLHEFYQIEPEQTELNKGILIHVLAGRRSACFFVDDIIGHHQTVIKGVPKYIASARGISGCTILSNGDVSLILDVRSIIDMSKNESWGDKYVGKTRH